MQSTSARVTPERRLKLQELKATLSGCLSAYDSVHSYNECWSFFSGLAELDPPGRRKGMMNILEGGALRRRNSK